MRRLALGFVALLVVPSLAWAAIDPAGREAALKYERTVQEGNKALRAAHKQAEATLSNLLAGKAPSEKEVADAIDSLQRAVSDFQSLLKEAPPPDGPEARAYAQSVNSYLAVFQRYQKEDLLKTLEAVKKPSADLQQNLAALEPLMKLARGTKAATDGIRNTRPAFLAAYEITPADLGRAPLAGSPPAANAAQVGTAAALEQAIAEGEKAFTASMQQVQLQLLPKLLLGGDLEPTEVESAFTGVRTSLAKLEANLAAVKVPDDAESKAYFAAAQKLVASTKEIDFSEPKKILLDKSLPADTKSTQFAEKMKSIGAAIAADFKKFKDSQEAFRKKHNLTPADAPRATISIPIGGAKGAPASEPAAPRTDVEPSGLPGSPLPATEPVPMPEFAAPGESLGAAPTVLAVPLTGPAALDQAIRNGEKAFRDSTEALQTKLLAKVALGGQLEPAEIEEGLAGVNAGIAKFEEQLAAVPVPDDPESKAYVAATKKLIGNLKRADFAGLARILTNKNLTAEARQNQIAKKVGGLGAGLERDFATFEKARKVFTEKHKLSGAANADGSIPSGEAMP